jgi:serine/threonine protein kinase/Tol biopolymer transport system component
VTLSAGTRLGPYEVLALVGTGGMGHVYRACDTRLDRTVAIKVSKEQFSERVEREARAIAALNHPHICHLYDVGPNYLVMEFVDGVPLAPPRALTRLVDLAIQIADALASAHGAGVVHRDLKPGNIMVTASGDVKILDFGLAAFQTPTRQAASMPTMASWGGTMVGTAPYMAPEQARGETVDGRTDLWSLGVVLYEAAVGVRPFEGPTDAAIFEALLARTPIPLRDRDPNVPVELDRIVSRLLEKDKALRYQSAADLAADLRRLRRAVETRSTAPDRRESLVAIDARSPHRRRGLIVAAGVGAVAIAAVVAWRAGIVGGGGPPPIPSPSEYTQLTNFTDSAVAPTLSSDGRMVTFIRGGESFLSRGQIYVKMLPNGESIRLTNDTDVKYGPVFTPDGSRVAYTRISRDGSWDTWTVSVNGAEPLKLLPNASGLVWTGGNRLLFSEIRGTGVHMGVISATETRSEQRDIYFPAHERAMAHFAYPSPDGRWLLISEMDGTNAWQPCRMVPIDGGTTGRQVGPRGACRYAAWSPDGRWMYFSAQVEGVTQLFRQRSPDGMPEQLTFGPTEAEGVTVAPDGRSLITSLGLRQSAVWYHDARGDRSLSSEGFASRPSLSADGRRVLYLLRANAAATSDELTSMDIQSGSTDRLLPGVSISSYDISADDTEVVFTRRGTARGIWLASLDRRTPPRLLIEDGDQPSFGRNGEVIFRMPGQTTNTLFRVRTDGGGRERIGTLAIVDKFNVAPGGQWVTLSIPGSGAATSAETVAVSLEDGRILKICTGYCQAGWTADGRGFFVSGVTVGPAEQTLVLPIPSGQALPEFPAIGLGDAKLWPHLRGSRVVPEPFAFPTSDAASYVFVKQELRRNLFRIPLR